MLSVRGIFTNASGTLISRTLGLFKNILVNFYFGLADTFWGAFQVVNTFRIFVGEGAINNIFIPTYKKVKEDSPGQIRYFLVRSFLFVFILSNLLAILLAVTSYSFAEVLLPGFSEEKKAETATSIAIMSLAVVLISLQSFLASVQIAKYNEFFGFAYSPVIANVLTIVTIGMFNHFGICILAWSVVIGALGMVLFQLILLLKAWRGFNLESLGKLRMDEIFKLDPYTKTFIFGFFSVILLSFIVQVNGIVSRFFGSFFEGVVAAITNAYIIVQVPIGMFSVAVSVVGLNALSEYFSKGDVESFRKLSGESVKTLNFFVVPVATLMIMFSYDIIRAVYRDIPGLLLGSEGRYSAFALKLTQELFSLYTLATYFLAMTSLLNRITFSRGSTKAPMITSLISLAANTFVNILLFFTIRSYIGIPIAFTIGSFVSLLYAGMVEYKNIGEKKEILRELVILLLVCFSSTVFVDYLLNFVKVEDTYFISLLMVLLKIILSLVLILVACYIAGLETIGRIVNKLVKKSN